jgi:hypothetical protein
MLSYFLILYGYLIKLFLIKRRSSKNVVILSDNIFIFSYFYNQLCLFFFYQVVFLFTLKINYIFFNFFFFKTFIFFLFFFFFIFFFILFFNKHTNNYREFELIYTVFFLFFLFSSSFFFVADIVTFFLNIELISMVTYIYFLYFLNTKVITFIKYKNLLSNYLWGSFFSTLFIIISIIFYVYYCGSVSFSQIQLCTELSVTWLWYFFLTSFLWKLGSSGFYFFKLELYQFLSMNSVFFFSITTILMYCFVLYFFFSEVWGLYNKCNYILLCVVLFLNIIILIRSFYLINIYQFLGFSAINLLSFILLLYLSIIYEFY